MNYKKITVIENSKAKGTIIDRLLALRNIQNKEKFLNPSKKDLISPYVFYDMEKAKKRIFDAIEKKEGILIWGDFDCDGVTSSTILYKALSKLNADPKVFIPDRLLHGHGLNSKELIKLISKEKIKLVITVDCAISNINEINLLKGLGVDTILTDHHTTDIELPKAYCIINPQVKNAIKEDTNVNDITSLTYNSGSIVAYKLANALLEEIDDNDLKDELLTIAGMGAIADIVPLLGENRSIVHLALDILNTKKENSNKGIYRLFFKNLEDKKITSYDVAFILAPRINACGRLANAKLSFDFLNEKDINKLDIIIEKLDNYNKIRQSKCQETQDEIIDYLKKNKQERNNPAIILLNPSWHIGIIGITASKIVELYNKPCFLMTVDENNNARCSIRSNDSYNVYQILKENEELFSGFGGHKLAGGCSFNLNEMPFEKVKEALLKTIQNLSQDEKKEDVLIADIELNPSDIDFELIEDINKLEPFGQDNQKPLFAMFDVTLEDFKPIGKEGNHLRLVFSKDDNTYQGVKWGENELPILKNSKCDIAFYPKLNTFNDTQTIQFELVDIYCDNLNIKKNDLKVFDHRKKTGILEQISSYLQKEGLDIGIYAKTPFVKENLSKYKEIKERFIESFENHQGIMFFDYPNSLEEFREIISKVKPKKIHFMNYRIDENLENYIKQISGMIKYCANKLNGNIDLDRFSKALGVSVNFIQITLEILEDINSIKILDIDKIEYIKSFAYEDFKNNTLYEVLKEEFEQTINFKKSLLNCEIKEIETILQGMYQ